MFTSIKKSSFWLKTDFLNLREFVALPILKIYYILFFLCVFILLISLIVLVLPADLGYSGEVKQFINSVKNWIAIKNVIY